MNLYPETIDCEEKSVPLVLKNSTVCLLVATEVDSLPASDDSLDPGQAARYGLKLFDKTTGDNNREKNYPK